MRHPYAEPKRDILAQLRAVADRGHPKRAMFAVPGNVADLPPIDRAILYMMPSSRGTLVTDDEARAWTFGWGKNNDVEMARLLGYPEHKQAAVAASGGRYRYLYCARIVQARDDRGNVITEALTSPAGLDETKRVLSAHGRVVVRNPVLAIVRRVVRRLVEKVI